MDEGSNGNGVDASLRGARFPRRHFPRSRVAFGVDVGEFLEGDPAGVGGLEVLGAGDVGFGGHLEGADCGFVERDRTEEGCQLAGREKYRSQEHEGVARDVVVEKNCKVEVDDGLEGRHPNR